MRAAALLVRHKVASLCLFIALSHLIISTFNASSIYIRHLSASRRRVSMNRVRVLHCSLARGDDVCHVVHCPLQRASVRWMSSPPRQRAPLHIRSSRDGRPPTLPPGPHVTCYGPHQNSRPIFLPLKYPLPPRYPQGLFSTTYIFEILSGISQVVSGEIGVKLKPEITYVNSSRHCLVHPPRSGSSCPPRAPPARAKHPPCPYHLNLTVSS